MQRTQDSQDKLEKKKNKIGEFIHLDFKDFHKANVNKTVWHWHKLKHIDQWNKINKIKLIKNKMNHYN